MGKMNTLKLVGRAASHRFTIQFVNLALFFNFTSQEGLAAGKPEKYPIANRFAFRNVEFFAA